MNDPSTRARLERWRSKMTRAVQSGDLDATLRAAARLAELDPDDADAQFLAGVAALDAGDAEGALASLSRATQLAPGRPDYWAQRAHCLSVLGRHGEAMFAAERAAGLPGADAATRNALGNVLARLGRHADAVQHFEAAVELMPGNTEFLYQLAQTYVYRGDFERARSACEAVLRIDPVHGRAHLVLADLLDGPPPAGRVEQLEAALAVAAGNLDLEVVLAHALARTLEASGDTAAAFTLWDRSKRAKKRATHYTIDQDKSMFTAMERVFDAAAVADPRPGDASAAPIFVIGMPRSGTTLVERILSSHSAVTAGGELTCLPETLAEAWSGSSRRLTDADALRAALAVDPARLGARYLASARLHVGEAARFVDKTPLNFFLVGFIRRSLPNAKIVCLRRGALDTCLANFRQLFALHYPQYRYSLSLEDTAEYFALFERLMAHWDTLLPGVVHHVHYERLVTEPEPEIRRLLDHVELELEPAVLRFEDNPAPVATASATQVRRPIYRESIGLWRRYERELAPLRERLAALGVAV